MEPKDAEEMEIDGDNVEEEKGDSSSSLTSKGAKLKPRSPTEGKDPSSKRTRLNPSSLTPTENVVFDERDDAGANSSTPNKNIVKAEEDDLDSESESGSDVESVRNIYPEVQVVEVYPTGICIPYDPDDPADDPKSRQVKANILELNKYLRRKWRLGNRIIPVCLRGGCDLYETLDFCINPTTGYFTITDDCDWSCGNLDEDVQYLKFLLHLRKHSVIEISCSLGENVERAKKFAAEHKLPLFVDLDLCVDDYDFIYHIKNELDDLNSLRKYLLDGEEKGNAAKEKVDFNKDPRILAEDMGVKFPWVKCDDMFVVMKAFSAWWASGLKQDKEKVKHRLDFIIKFVEEFSSNRLRYNCYYRKADNIKLKLDIAARVGIIDDPGSLGLPADFPDHREWPVDAPRFSQVEKLV